MSKNKVEYVRIISARLLKALLIVVVVIMLFFIPSLFIKQFSVLPFVLLFGALGGLYFPATSIKAFHDRRFSPVRRVSAIYLVSTLFRSHIGCSSIFIVYFWFVSGRLISDIS